MRKILLTGCSGQLGHALQAEYGDEVKFILTDMAGVIDNVPGGIALDISDAAQVHDLVMSERPDVIINCAAITNVDGCETNYDAAYRVNALGPRNLAASANDINAKLIHISTDYVFSGTDPNPMTESEIPDPISAYGQSKLAGEQYVRQFSNRWFMLRTAWLYGEGKNFVQTMLRLSETHDEVSVVNDQFGSPTSAVELARVIHRLEPTTCYGLYHATCEGQVCWADFAMKIFELAGKSTRVIPISSMEYKKRNPESAARPPFSILENEMLRMNGFPPMQDWEAAIVEYFSR
ncbi:MAG: dTDP-4-dehydrorhamnose reductase [Eubacterium sp.]|nr:dTDP-4-dehydrorhamnose reductase [Eubacterium sp.]